MQYSIPAAFYKNFMGNAPEWYKNTIFAFLVINPILFYFNPYLAGWVLVLEFIFTLAMALKCYPLQPGGLLAFEALLIGMTTPGHVKHEITENLEVLLLLIFMVAGIYFMKNLLLFTFTKLLIRLRSKVALSVAFTFFSAFLSAFLDALTVIAVIISVSVGFYSIYHKVVSGMKAGGGDHDLSNDDQVESMKREDLDGFRAFLRNLMMHAGIGTALGGVCTMVGEPQNLIIAQKAGWEFIEFVIRMSPITFPVFFAGLLTTFFLEKTKVFGYGAQLPESVRHILEEYDKEEDKQRCIREKVNLFVQCLIALWLVVALAFHLAAVGLIGLSVIILATTTAGITDEHQIGKAFEEALPFTALLCVFFAIVAVIVDQGLFKPVITAVLQYDGKMQLLMFFIANGVLSMVSDNVFVGTVYINEVYKALADGQITRDQFDMLAVAINTGTNLPSVATPNGQAAFLFLLTSSIAPLIRLSYGRMVIMAFPYTIVLTIVGMIFTYTSLESWTQNFYDWGWIEHASSLPAAEVKTDAHH
ncbi:sodium/proton antiporter NhaB [Algicola sagamiensis]|uniref:sodium/proton antiporter NhaB n=1 Tax=Algicola sagamiensis TaxID=163869 RepID=UPI00039C4322|nr:sodium/proton antiporter NhaB [Algicola sagamiensis]